MEARILTANDWRGFRREAFPSSCWEAQRDILHALPGQEAISLVTREARGDFDLSLEWRLPPGGNSGIFYLLVETRDEPWQSAPEMQLVHDAGHPDGRVPETSCGAIYGLIAPRNVPACPPGIYNIARITVRGSLVEHWLNGSRVLVHDLASPAFRERVTRSKFAAYPEFAQARDGLLGLQHHGGEAWFRNIRLEAPPP